MVLFSINIISRRKVQDVRKLLPDSKVKNIFLTLSSNIINETLMGYCVRIELYSRTEHAV